MTRKTILLITALALLTLSTASAQMVPRDEDGLLFRPWAETGDCVGLFNQVSFGYEYLDAYGYQGRAAEDWNRLGQDSFAGHFTWVNEGEGGNRMLARGFGDTRADDEASGSFMFSTATPGVYGLDVSYRRAHHFYDGTIEQAYPMNVPGTALDPLPMLRWNRGRADASYRLSEAFSVRAFADDIRRVGSKASLARGATGLAAPALKTYDTKTIRAGAVLVWRSESFRADCGVTVGKDDGDRNRGGVHAREDDRSTVAFQGGVAWDATSKLTFLGRGSVATVESKPTEKGVKAGDLEQSTSAGVIGAVWRPAPAWNVRLSGRVQKVDVDGNVTEAGVTDAIVDRERSRTALRADVRWRNTSGTRASAEFRHDVSELDETLSWSTGAMTPAFNDELTEQTRTTTRFGFKARQRLNRVTAVKAGLRLEKVDIELDTPVSHRYWQGDRTYDTMRGTLGLTTRPLEHVRLEAGGEILSRTFERDDVAGVENTFDAKRLTAVASWLVDPRLSVFGAMSWGHEEADLPAGAEAPDGAAAIVYDTTTLRLAPGAVLSPGWGGLRVEAQYELVRNEDSVENDYDRMTLRASYPLGERMRVSALFRKYEFDENRWDDYILDLYGLSVSAKF